MRQLEAEDYGASPEVSALAGYGLSKRLGSVLAVDRVDLRIEPGTLGRHVPAGAQLQDDAICARQGVGQDQRGPGDNWLCTVYVVTKSPTDPTEVNYGVTVKPNGFLNPLLRLGGCFDVAL